MKKLFFTLLLLVSTTLSISAQNLYRESIVESKVEVPEIKIPTENEKVVFVDTIPLAITSDEAYLKISKWIGKLLSIKRGKVLENNKEAKEIKLHIVDNLEVEKKALSMYSIYLEYQVHIVYRDGYCITRVENLKYIESQEIQNSNPHKIEGEEVLLTNKYKVLFVQDAARKIKIKTADSMDDLFKSLQQFIAE